MFGAQYALNQKIIISVLTFEGNYQWENVSQQEMSTIIHAWRNVHSESTKTISVLTFEGNYQWKNVSQQQTITTLYVWRKVHSEPIFFLIFKHADF